MERTTCYGPPNCLTGQFGGLFISEKEDDAGSFWQEAEWRTQYIFTGVDLELTWS